MLLWLSFVHKCDVHDLNVCVCVTKEKDFDSDKSQVCVRNRNQSCSDIIDLQLFPLSLHLSHSITSLILPPFLQDPPFTYPLNSPLLTTNFCNTEVMSDSFTAGWQCRHGNHWSIYVSRPICSPCLIKDFDVPFVLLKIKTSGNQIWGILMLFTEKVQPGIGFFFYIPLPEITRKCLSCT